MQKTTKTIVHLIATNFYGGPEKQIVEHLKRLNSDHFDGIVVSFLEGGPNEILDRAADADVVHYGISMSGPLDIRAQWQLNSFIRRKHVDLLCVHGYKAAVMGWLAGNRNDIPVIAFSRGYTAENRKIAFYEWLDRLVLKRVTGIISVSEGQKRRLASYGIRGRKSWVVHNGVVPQNLDKMKAEEIRKNVFRMFEIPLNSKLVVSAGRLSPEKGHEYLVDAVKQVVESGNNAVFVFCGDGVCRESLENQARHRGISEWCRFPGFRRDMHDIFQAMDLLALPSLTEGLPNVVLEAFSWAKPVVATRVGGVPELVDDGENGLLVEPGRPDLLGNGICRCLATPDKMRAMGQKGYEKIRQHFSFDQQARKLETIYKSLLKAR